MNIESRMTKRPVTIQGDARAIEASELMEKERVSRLPVIDSEGRLIGLVSQKDITLAITRVPQGQTLHKMAHDLNVLRVDEIMSKEPVTITKDRTVEEAARTMVDLSISCLPVVEEGKLVGLVTKSDMFRILLELFGARSFGLRLTCIVDEKPGQIAAIARAVSQIGGDIISFGALNGFDETSRTLTLKVDGCDQACLVSALSPLVREIVDVREA